jgi:hypothetical protein
MYKEVINSLKDPQNEAKYYIENNNIKTKFSLEHVGDFFKQVPEVYKLIKSEPEILLFVFIQWMVICLAYLAWVQMLYWVPDSVWQAISDNSNKATREPAFLVINLLLFGWSLLIIAIASYPIGLCNAAMTVSHNLRISGKESTIYNCFAIGTDHIGRIWIFTTIDAWFTVSAILRRLPKKGGKGSLAFYMLKELLYYAWKFSTLAVLPALVNGKDFVDAGKDSVSLLKADPARALGLRLGYSAVCWIVAALSYILSIAYLFFYVSHYRHGEFPKIYEFYFIMAVPIILAVGIIIVLIRPFFVLGVAAFYTDHIDVKTETEKDVMTVPPFINVLFSWGMILFIFLVAQVLLIIFFGDKLGWVNWIHHLAQPNLNVR